MAFNNLNTDNVRQRVEFKIEQHLGEIGQNRKTNWTKEVNIVKWNNGDSKLDIREWDPKHERMSKGITFTESETARLTAILSQSFPNDCVRTRQNENVTRAADVAIETAENEEIPFENAPAQEESFEDNEKETIDGADEQLPGDDEISYERVSEEEEIAC